jgi:glycine betaine/proline transport system ATP-binding protein
MSKAPAGQEVAIAGRSLSKVYGLDRKKAAAVLAADDPAQAARRAGGYLGVHDIDLEVRRGEMFVVMGLSGSGKSTLLRMMNRLHEPSAGRIEVDGEDIVAAPRSRVRELRNNKIGMVFQHFSLFPHRTVRDNVAYGLKVRGVPRARRLARAEETLERVGLAGRGDHYPQQLSGGMKQRVGLARALAVDPPILLMDEPFSALDPLIRRDMQDLLLQLQREDRRTTVFVTHDLNEAMRIGDHVMVLRDGRVVQVGPGAEIIARPADDYVNEFVADVDRARVLTAADLVRPPLLTCRVQDRPEDVLRLLGNNEANGAFVLDEAGRLVGVVTDSDLGRAVARHHADLAGVVTQDYQRVEPDDLLADIMHLAGRHVVPLTVVDADGRLAGVVPRAAILSVLSNAREVSRA